jgi:AraC-like DNA-binding protein
MVKEVEEGPRGILKPQVGEQKFRLARYEPSSRQLSSVEHYWSVHWDLRGQAPYPAATLPHPAVHLTVEPTGAFIVGIVTHKFTRLLSDSGWVFGIKFKPGGFYPLLQRPVATVTDKNIPLAQLFGEAATDYAASIRAASSEEEQVRIAEGFLAQRLPLSDANVLLANQIVETISAERTITKVDQVVSRFDINKRALQRLFSQYVGVSPKWVIQRYRLHEATEQLAAGTVVDWAKLAVDLGYFDQAHFIKDFKAIVGQTPAEYAKEASAR